MYNTLKYQLQINDTNLNNLNFRKIAGEGERQREGKNKMHLLYSKHSTLTFEMISVGKYSCDTDGEVYLLVGIS